MDASLSVSPLQPHMIRWFYRPPGNYWQPFCGYDSLILEEEFVRLRGGADSVLPVSVLGDMYEVELYMTGSTMTPIYWDLATNSKPPEKPWPVMRAMWYEVGSSDKLYPLEEKDAFVLEATHCQQDWRKAMQQASSAATSSDGGKVILNQVDMKTYDVLWFGPCDIVKVKKSTTSLAIRKVGAKIRMDSLGSTRLQRGYREPASREDRPPPIGHLVFAVHGIGQNLENSDVIKSVTDLRDACKQVAMKQFAGSWKNQRVEIIPIEWRTSLALDQDTLCGITPHGVKSVRNLVNNTVIDVFYYMSSCYGPEILTGFCQEIHKRHRDFMARHPRFLVDGGTISLFGHSLGSVICYDLMYNTCKAQATAADETDCPMASPDDQFAELLQLKRRVAVLERELGAVSNTLQFRVDHFFAVGSPLGLFIMMREQAKSVMKAHQSASSFLPSSVCQRIYNLHHPSDPVAYRLEPLINPLYCNVRPVRVDTASSKPSKSAVAMAEGPTAESKPPAQQGWWGSLISSSVVKTIASVSASAIERASGPDKLMNDDSKLAAQERLKERLDFMLKEGVVENSYINTITAHTCYWTSNDVAMFLLLQLYSYKPQRARY